MFLWNLIWTCVPFLVGATAFAEERRLHVSDWQTTLPVSLWRQWTIKAAVVFALGFGLGVLLPTLTEALFPTAVPRIEPTLAQLLTVRLWTWGVGCLLGLYASSLSRTFVQALTGTVALGAGLFGWFLLVGWCLEEWVGPILRSMGRVYSDAVSRDALAFGALGIVMAPLLLGLSRWNFRGPHAIPHLARTNALALISAAALVLIVPLGLVDRVWERAWIEPRPGPAIPPRPDVTPNLCAPGFIDVVLAPEGGLHAWWHSAHYPVGPSFTNQVIGVQASNGVVPLHPDHDWTRVAATMWSVYSLKADGSIWRLSHPMAAAYGEDLKLTLQQRYDTDPTDAVAPWWSIDAEPSWATGQPVLQRWNAGNNWKAIAASSTHVVALKHDGTLWAWGGNQCGQLGRSDVDQLATPSRIGNHADWRVIAAANVVTLAANADGRVWQWGGWPRRDLDPGERAQPQLVASGTNWTQLVSTDQLSYGFQADGLVRLLPLPHPTVALRNQTAPVLSTKPWVSVTHGFEGQTFLIDAEGRLWRTPFLMEARIFSAATGGLQPTDGGVRIGSRSDWVVLGCMASLPSTCYGLTADGVLWRWGADWSRRRPTLLDYLGVPPSLRPRPFARLQAQDAR